MNQFLVIYRDSAGRAVGHNLITANARIDASGMAAKAMPDYPNAIRYTITFAGKAQN